MLLSPPWRRPTNTVRRGHAPGHNQSPSPPWRRPTYTVRRGHAPVATMAATYPTHPATINPRRHHGGDRQIPYAGGVIPSPPWRRPTNTVRRGRNPVATMAATDKYRTPGACSCRHHGGDLRDSYAWDNQQQRNVCTGVCNNRMLYAIPSVQHPKRKPW